MHPNREIYCDKLVDTIHAPHHHKHSHMKVPSPPVIPPKPKVKKTKYKKCPPRFFMLDKDWYQSWCVHRRLVETATAVIDTKPPHFDPEMYCMPRRLGLYAYKLENNFLDNKALINRINLIQKNGGIVDCRWNKATFTETFNKAKLRGKILYQRKIMKDNRFLYNRIVHAMSDLPSTKEYDTEWAKTKTKLIASAQLPFILFDVEHIDRGIKDPELAKPPFVIRKRVHLDIRVKRGASLGMVTVELFNDIVPKTCQLFLSLVKGNPETGHAYTGTKFFRIVPELFCLGGDVSMNNGYGHYNPDPDPDSLPIKAENFKLKHSVPGILSMAVSKETEVCGQFYIVFKPLPQLDGKGVVFGRITAGPAQFLERISALGLPLGTPIADVIIKRCGTLTRSGRVRSGPIVKVVCIELVYQILYIFRDESRRCNSDTYFTECIYLCGMSSARQ